MRVTALLAFTVAVTACGGGGDGGPIGGGGPKPVASIDIVTIKSTFLTGESAVFAATPLDASGNPVTGAAAATWESTAPGIATVGSDGTVRAVAAGTGSIRATIGSINATRVITVLATGAGAVVTMPNLTFAPFTVTITRGQAVFFDFPVLAHNVIFTARAGVPADIQVTANATVNRTFATAGTFPYDCTIHNGMRGEVVVNP